MCYAHLSASTLYVWGKPLMEVLHYSASNLVKHSKRTLVEEESDMAAVDRLVTAWLKDLLLWLKLLKQADAIKAEFCDMIA